MGVSLLLGLAAALANIAGGLILVRAHGGSGEAGQGILLRGSLALGSGFMLAVALLEMVPEGLKLAPHWAPGLVLAGYCTIHLLEHTLSSHFHFGEEEHAAELFSAHTSYSVLLGLAVHAIFDGVAIASGFAVSLWLGVLIFLAVALHKVPEGFTVASVMLASGRSSRTALRAAMVLAVATVVGVGLIALAPHLVSAGMPLAAGVAIYVAATDLVPEINREPGVRMALVFFAGVGLFLLLRWALPAV